MKEIEHKIWTSILWYTLQKNKKFKQILHRNVLQFLLTNPFGVYLHEGPFMQNLSEVKNSMYFSHEKFLKNRPYFVVYIPVGKQKIKNFKIFNSLFVLL